jgi:RND family efflux transporter MFP subunit
MGKSKKSFAIVFLLFVFFSCGKGNKKGNEKVPTFQGKKDEVGVFVINLIREKNSSSPSISFVGSTQPERQSVVSSKVSGRITKLFVDIGFRVKKGQNLAKIDDTDYKNNLERAKAELERIKAQLELAKLNYERAENLIKTKSIAQAEYDSAKSNYQSLLAAYETAKKNLERAEIDLNETNILAPYDGIVVEKRADVGSFVGPQSPIFVIQSSKTFFLGKIAEKDITKLKIGDILDVEFPSLKKVVKGKVSSIKPASTGTGFDVIIDLSENVPANLLGIAHLEISQAEKFQTDGLYLLPYEAIYISQEGEFIFTADNGIARKIKISVIENFSDFALVKVPEGITQIISPVSDKLYDGQKVRIAGERRIE